LAQIYKRVAPNGAFNPPLCLPRRLVAKTFGAVPRLRDEGGLVSLSTELDDI